MIILIHVCLNCFCCFHYILLKVIYHLNDKSLKVTYQSNDKSLLAICHLNDKSLSIIIQQNLKYQGSITKITHNYFKK